MPITASLGSLSYSRVAIGVDNWYIQFENEILLKSITNIGSMLYLLADDGTSALPLNTSIIQLQGNNRPRTIWETQIYPLAFPVYSNTATATGATQDNIVIGGIANFDINQPIRFSGSVFGGVSAGVTYYIISKPTANSISVSLTVGGAVVPLTTSTGSMTVSKYFGTTSPWIGAYKIKYNSYNSSLYAVGNMYTYQLGYVDGVSQNAIVEKIDLTGNYLSTQRNSSPPVALVQPYRYYGDIAFLSSTDYFAIGETVPTNRPRTFYSRTDTSTQSYENYYQGSQSTSTPSQSVFCEITSAGSINIIYQYNNRSIAHDTAYWSTNIQNVNPSIGAVNWTTTLYPGNDVSTPTTNWPQYFTEACLDSIDNTYIVTKETRLVPPTSTYGGFIIKLNSSGIVQWQKHIDEFQPSSVCVDDVDDIYVLGQLSGDIYISKFDPSGTLQWCNKLSTSTYDLDSNKIIYYNGYIYITGNLVGQGGALFRLNADGSIPGSGSYNIVTPTLSYTLTYSSISLTISTSNILISYAAASVAASSSTIDAITSTTTNNITTSTVIPLR